MSAWPSLIIIVLLAIGLGMALVKDGEPKGNYSFWYELIAVLILVAILAWGGFFKPLFGG